MMSNLGSIIEHNLNYVPKHLSEIYISIVKNTYNIANVLSPDRFRELYATYKQKYREVGSNSGKILFIEHGETGLRELFFKVNKIEGRLDLNLPFLNVTHILQFLALASCSEDQTPELDSIIQQLREIETIVLLSDICISGSSLLGDLSAIREISNFLSPDKEIEVIALPLCISESAYSSLNKEFSFLAAQELIPNKYSLLDPDSIVVTDDKQKTQLNELAEWFAGPVVQKQGLLWQMSKAMQDPGIVLWGFDNKGWLLTSDLNTPNNSFPMLWHKPVQHPYLPPFPRTSSRNYQTNNWNMRELYWKIINKSLVKL